MIDVRLKLHSSVVWFTTVFTANITDRYEHTVLTRMWNEQVKYMTDGMLIREAVSDPCLRGYSVIFVDEAHERTVNTDVLLGLLKLAQQKRYDSKHPLKLVIMSATLEENKMLDFFPNSKPAHIPGRQYPVELFYTTKKQESYVKAATDTVLQVLPESPFAVVHCACPAYTVSCYCFFLATVWLGGGRCKMWVCCRCT